MPRARAPRVHVAGCCRTRTTWPCPRRSAPARRAAPYNDGRVARAFNAHRSRVRTTRSCHQADAVVIDRAAGDHRRHILTTSGRSRDPAEQPGVARDQHEGQRRHGRGKLQHHRVDRADGGQQQRGGGSPVRRSAVMCTNPRTGRRIIAGEAWPTKPQQKSRPPAARSPCRIRRRRSPGAGRNRSRSRQLLPGDRAAR